MSAQKVIEGQISSEEEALAFAVIKLEDASNVEIQALLSDDTGQFTFFPTENGTYSIISSMVGYQSDTTTLEVTDISMRYEVAIQLEATAEAIEQVEVSTKKPLFEQQIDRTVVNVENSIVSKGSNVLSILERSPGVRVDRVNQQLQLQGNQGVVVMLNGRQMRMDDRGLMQLLEGMNSDNIEKIELITSPPASFDAEGGAGVINIVTKTNLEQGLLHNFSVNAGYGKREKIGGSYSLNYQKGKMHLFTALSANYDNAIENMSLTRQNTFNDVVTRTFIDSYRPAQKGAYNYRAGIDYDITDRTTIGALASGFVTTWDLDGLTTGQVSDNLGNALNTELRALEQNDWVHWMFNINARHRLKDSSMLTLDLDYLDYFDDNPTTYTETNAPINSPVETNTFFSAKQTPIDFQVVKLDYQKKLNDIFSFETGVKGTLTYFENDVELADIENGERIYNDQFTDNFVLDENLGAAYASFDYKKGNFSAKAGGRYEYYSSDLTSRELGAILLQDYGRFFPSAFLGYNLTEDKVLQLSYGERIQRPQINWIAPAFFYWGYNSFVGGNPDVQPALSRRLSASYRIKELFFQVQYTHEDQALTWQPVVFSETNETLIRTENLDYQRQASLNVSTPLKITPWWESNFNVSGYLREQKAQFAGQNQANVTSTYLDGNLSQNFFLPKDFTLELNTRYNSNVDIGLGVFQERHQWDLGLKKELSAQSQLSFSATDLFDTGSFFQVVYDQPELNLIYNQTYDIEAPVFRVTFSHNFGNTSLKKRGDRQTGSEEERSRMN